MENKFLNCFCLTLTIIGAVNWGLIGFVVLYVNICAFSKSGSFPFWKYELDLQNHLRTGRTFGSVSAQFLWNALLQ